MAIEAAVARPAGRPRLDPPTCESHGSWGRSPNGKLRQSCPGCGQERLAATIARARDESILYRATDEAKAIKQRRRERDTERSRVRRLTAERQRYEREQKSRRRSTIPGQLVLAKQQVKTRIATKISRINELERIIAIA